MRRERSLLLVAAVCTGVVGLWAASALSESFPGSPFRQLTAEHTRIGVSQLWAGQAHTRRNVGIRMYNPVEREQVATLIVYERLDEGGNEGGSETDVSEVFRGCLLQRLSPHASYVIDDFRIEIAAPLNDERFYGEVIAAPVDPVPIGQGRVSRKANGLGIIVRGGGSNESDQLQPLFPNLFSLPSSKVVPGQREAARQCICGQLSSEGLPPNLYLGFGVSCTA